MEEFFEAYRILYSVYFNKSYSNLEINKREIKGNIDLVYKIVYGVLENDLKLEKVLNTYSDQKLDNAVKIILKIGIYALDNLDSMPDYAIVNNAVTMTEKMKVSSAKKYVNWLLRAYIRKERTIQYKNDVEKASCMLNVPAWVLQQIALDYSNSAVNKIFNVPKNYLEEVRANTRVISHKKLLEKLTRQGIEFKDFTDYVQLKNSEYILSLFKKGEITYHSSSSMQAVKALDLKDGESMLDLCAAPGGKSIFALESAQNLDVTACDIYDHRLELIKEYAARMKEKNLKIIKNDGAILNEAFTSKFDKVLVDAPCSGLGVYMKKPDILIRLKKEDIIDLSKIQKEILFNALKYLKVGGMLVYSTCTLFKLENENVVNEVLKSVDGYAIEPFVDGELMKTIFPSSQNRDGFFIARIKRIK